MQSQINSIFCFIWKHLTPPMYDNCAGISLSISTEKNSSLIILSIFNPLVIHGIPLLNPRTAKQFTFNMSVHGTTHKCWNSGESFRGPSGPTF